MPDFRPADTSPKAWELSRQAHLQLGPERRVHAAFEASEFVRDVTREGIRLCHPEYDEAQIDRALFRRIYGETLFLKVYPAAALRP